MIEDEPLLSPSRLIRAFAWYCWYLDDCQRNGTEPFPGCTLRLIFRTYRRALHAHEKGLY